MRVCVCLSGIDRSFGSVPVSRGSEPSWVCSGTPLVRPHQIFWWAPVWYEFNITSCTSSSSRGCLHKELCGSTALQEVFESTKKKEKQRCHNPEEHFTYIHKVGLDRLRLSWVPLSALVMQPKCQNTKLQTAPMLSHQCMHMQLCTVPCSLIQNKRNISDEVQVNCDLQVFPLVFYAWVMILIKCCFTKSHNFYIILTHTRFLKCKSLSQNILCVHDFIGYFSYI